MIQRILMMAVLVAATGCSSDPTVALRDALAKAASTPHTWNGQATRKLGSAVTGGAPVTVSWDLAGTYCAPYSRVDLKGKTGTRTAMGREGWWVESYAGIWRAYPPPAEAIEWLDPAGLTATWGADQTIDGKKHKRIIATHPAGEFHFDIDPDTGRIARASGIAVNGSESYEFNERLYYSAVTVEPEPEAKTLLEALSGARPAGDDAATRSQVAAAWKAIPASRCSIATLQIDFLNASELHRRSGYLEQDPPLRAWNIADSGRQVYLYSDGSRTLKADSLDAPPTEIDAKMKPAVDELDAKLITRAFVVGEQASSGEKCRLVVVELGGAEGVPGSMAWLWIAPNGRLQRQVLIAKAVESGGGHRESTTMVDFVFSYDRPDEEMMLLQRTKALFRR